MISKAESIAGVQLIDGFGIAKDVSRIFTAKGRWPLHLLASQAQVEQSVLDGSGLQELGFIVLVCSDVCTQSNRPNP